jgi:hypothetical protein
LVWLRVLDLYSNVLVWTEKLDNLDQFFAYALDAKGEPTFKAVSNKANRVQAGTRENG